MSAPPSTYSRLYFAQDYVEGGADMVLGRAVAVFDRSTFHVLNRSGVSMTDSSVSSASPYGFLITGSTINTDGNPGSLYLGRPYPEAAGVSKAQVTIRNTTIGGAVNNNQPWKDYDANNPWTSGRFFEYQNSGPGSTIVDPAYRPQLSDADAANSTAATYLAGSDAWNPII